MALRLQTVTAYFRAVRQYCDDKLAVTSKATYEAVSRVEKLLFKVLKSRAEGKPVSEEAVKEVVEASKSIFTFDETSIRDLEESSFWPGKVSEPEKSPESRYKIYQK